MGARGRLPTRLPTTHAPAVAGKRAPVVMLSKPKDLGAEGDAEWTRVTRELRKAGRLGPTDRAVVIAHCRAWQNFCNLSRALDDEGYTDHGDRGQRVQSPLLSAWFRMHTALLASSAALALHVATRLRMPVAEEPDAGAEDWAQFDQPRAQSPKR